MSNLGEQQALKVLRQSVFDRRRATEQRGRGLLIVIPLFILPLCAAAYFLIPETAIPALMLLGGLVAAMAYVWRGLRRLETEPAVLLRALIKEKRIHQSTHTTTHTVSRRHSFLLDVDTAVGLRPDDSETQRPDWLEDETQLSVTQEIYDHCAEGDRIYMVAMPHDRSIYQVLDVSGHLFPDDTSREPAAQ